MGHQVKTHVIKNIECFVKEEKNKTPLLERLAWVTELSDFSKSRIDSSMQSSNQRKSRSRSRDITKPKIEIEH